MNAGLDTELRQTPAPTTIARKPARQVNPVRVFVDKDRLALFWFIVAALAVGCALFTPFFLVQKFKERERIVVIDPAHNYFVSPLLTFEEAKELHAQQTTLATTAFLERNPTGFDSPELLKRLFLKFAYEKAVSQQASEAAEFKAKQLHQKAEIAQITLLQTRENFVLTQVSGQLIRTGIFQEKAFSEAVPFKLAFKMRRNPDMTQNGRFPTAVSDFKYEPDR